MVKVALIGATGFVGSHLLKELVDRKYEVIAIARHIDKIPAEYDKVTTASVDVNDNVALVEALKGANVVVSAFMPKWTDLDIHEQYLKGAESIQTAVRQAGIKRFIVIGGAGSLYVGDKQLVDTDDFPEDMKPAVNAVRDYLEVLKRETYLDWAFFSPAIEMNASVTTGRTGKYELGTDQPIYRKDKHSIISVEDVAVVIVDEIEKKRHSRQRFTAGYAK